MCLIYVTKNTTFHKRYCNIGTCPVNIKNGRSYTLKCPNLLVYIHENKWQSFIK